MATKRDKVFISYGHADMRPTNWLTSLHCHLSFFKRAKDLVVWDDQQTLTGKKWRDQIRRAIDEARVAILLVGPSFLGSEFIADHELPPLLEAAEKDGIQVLPLIVGYCAYAQSDLEKFQSYNSPEQPLESLNQPDQNKLLRDFSVSVYEACRRYFRFVVLNPSEGDAVSWQIQANGMVDGTSDERPVWGFIQPNWVKKYFPFRVRVEDGEWWADLSVGVEAIGPEKQRDYTIYFMRVERDEHIKIETYLAIKWKPGESPGVPELPRGDVLQKIHVKRSPDASKTNQP